MMEWWRVVRVVACVVVLWWSWNRSVERERARRRLQYLTTMRWLRRIELEAERRDTNTGVAIQRHVSQARIELDDV